MMGRKQAGKHDFGGMCAPGNHIVGATFSLGIFEWVPKSSKKGLKRGKVKVRIRGFSSNPKPVYAQAKQIAKELDSGIYTGPKNVNMALLVQKKH